MPINLSKLPPPDPNEDEGIIHKAWRLNNSPIVKLLGLQPALENATAPTLKDAEAQKSAPKDEGLLHQAFRMATLRGTPAEYKGLLAGSTNAVTPALAEQAASLGTGALGTLANAAVAGQGAHDAADPSLPTWQRVMGGVGAITGGAGALGTGLRAVKARGASSAIGDVAKDAKTATQGFLQQQVDALGNDIANHKPFSEDIIRDTYPELHAEVTKNPGGKYAKQIWGDKGKPNPQSIVEKADYLAKEREQNALQQARNENTRDKFIQKDNEQTSKNLNAQEKFVEKTGVQDTRNLKARDKFIADQGVQDTRNEKAVNKFVNDNAVQESRNLNAQDKFKQGIVKAQAGAEAEDAKRTAAGIAQSEAERQANAIEGLKDRLTETREPSTIRETVSGPGEHGGTARATFMRTEPPPPEDEGTVAGAIGGKPVSPTSKAPRGPATSKGFNSPEDAQKAADATGGAFSVAQNPNDNLHYLVPEGQQPPWNDAVQQSLRPYNQLTATEQKAIKPLLRQARKAGVAPDRLESLGDELADKLGMIKAGRESADDTNSTLESAIKAVKNSGSPLLDDGSEEIGKLRQFLRQQGVSTRGVLTKTGKYRSLDQAGEDLKGVLPGFDNAKETSLLDHLQSLKPETEQSAVDELISKHKGNWWEKPTAEVHDYTEGDIPTVDVEPPSAKPEGEVPRPPKVEEIPSDSAEPEGPADDSFNPAELEKQSFTPGGQGPEMSVPEFAQALSQEGKKPLVPLPEQTFNLTGQDAPRAPEPSLFDAPQEPAPQAPNMGVPDEGAIAQGGVPAPQVQPEAPITVNMAGGGPKVWTPETIADMNEYPDLSKSETPTQPGGGAIPARLFKSQLEAAGPHYGETQAAYKAGEAPKEAARTAGAAAQRINKEAQAAGAAKERAAQIASVQEELADPATPPETKSMLQSWLTSLMSEKGLGSERGAASVAPMLRIAGGLTGAAIGGATDPLGNRGASAAAGGAIGGFAPELAGVLKSAGTAGIPQLAKASQKAAPYTERGLDFLNRLHNSGLLSPLSVLKKAAGDVGGLSLAAFENPRRAGDMLRQFISPEGRALLKQNFMEGFNGKDQEALSGLENFFQGNTPANPTGAQKLASIPGKIMSASGRTMGGLTKATKGILGESGFSEPEQQYYTLTAYPEHSPTKKLYEALRGGNRITQSGEPEKGSKLLSHLAPFARIGVNRLERGWEYSPFGLSGMSNIGGDEEKARKVMTKALLGSAVGTGAYQLTPDDFVREHPTAASSIAALGGPLGLPILAGMALKTANKNTDDDEDALKWAGHLNEASQAIGRDIPGLRLLEDITGRSFPMGFGRNYMSGYTNFMRPLALMTDPEQPDVSSKDLPAWQKLLNQAASNIPIVRGMLPRK